MTFLEFKNQLFDLACFNIYQVYAWQPDLPPVLYQPAHCIVVLRNDSGSGCIDYQCDNSENSIIRQ